MFNNKRIMVTGGTGSWGHELIRQLLPQNPKEIIVFPAVNLHRWQ